MTHSAVDPTRSATVFASAGTGKTWQLVTRLLRLLLAGAAPGSILAVTFTRKAAGEMQERLLQRLADWAICSDEALDAALRECGAPIDSNTRHLARNLYETVLNSPQPVRTTTFHAFCHDLLARFPLEAGVPPGFELIEDSEEQKQTAWEQLMALGDGRPDEHVSTALNTLLEIIGSMASVKTALDAFLDQRADWWAWIEGHEDDPLGFAATELDRVFDVKPHVDEADITAAFFSDPTCADLQDYAKLLGNPAASKTHKTHAATIAQLLSEAAFDLQAFDTIKKILLTGKGEPRALKPSKKVIAEIGEGDADTLVTLHHQLCDKLQTTADALARLTSRRLNGAWMTAGVFFLARFQEIKAQRRQLDFSDLEWRTYRLLTASSSADAIQYRLDQQIDHLLIDEFQDTNPTQWRLVLPLLEEFASAVQERPRTVFLVGDVKQSIYSFRRANPALQGMAADWLKKHLGSAEISLNQSWRSAPAIMDAVNTIFRHETFAGKLTDFGDHDTHQKTHWGRIEILSPVAPTETEDEEGSPDFRNPLERPLHTPPGPQVLEAEQIANRIRELVDNRWVVGSGDDAHPIGYGDIMILLRQRTHADKIEAALRTAGIPFRGTARGSLLDRLEVRDIRQLLELLATPQDNLALAQVLRSPLFSASDDDLIGLAGHGQGSWWERMEALATSNPVMQRATTLLQRWRGNATALPLHDLLDQIFFEGDVLNRYASANAAWQREQVSSNLQRLLELALEIDSGRYPSLSRFLGRLREMEASGTSAPSEPTPQSAEPKVEILTIHGAKGLEAPVVFYVNLSSTSRGDQAWSPLVDWPADADRPRHFLLQPKKDCMDSVSNKIVARASLRKQTEDANLLYVALTRARQMLVLTGSATTARDKNEDLFSQLRTALTTVGKEDDSGHWHYQTGEIPRAEHIPEPGNDLNRPTVPAGLAQAVTLPVEESITHPSQMGDDEYAPVEGEADGALRGTAIHRMLELMSGPGNWHGEALQQRIAADHNLAIDDPRLAQWLTEAQNTLTRFPKLFDTNWQERRNEVPIIYRQNGQTVYGIIDRLLVRDREAWIIDYKTHRIATDDEARKLANHYQAQMAWYREGVKRLFPDHEVHCKLLFTAAGILLDMNQP